MLAVIGGSGLGQLANLNVSHREVLRTPYGEPSGAVTFGQICGREVAFLARHGYGHTIPPHEVNYQANIWALCNRGVTRIVSVASVGCIRADLKPGDISRPLRQRHKRGHSPALAAIGKPRAGNGDYPAHRRPLADRPRTTATAFAPGDRPRHRQLCLVGTLRSRDVPRATGHSPATGQPFAAGRPGYLGGCQPPSPGAAQGARR